jgi:hypothetical protein
VDEPHAAFNLVPVLATRTAAPEREDLHLVLQGLEVPVEVEA